MELRLDHYQYYATGEGAITLGAVKGYDTYDFDPKVRAWLAERPPFTQHFTPTYASWINQVERWFTLITQRRIRRGSAPRF